MKKILIISFLVLSCTCLYAQENSVKDLPTFSHERFYVGGIGGFAFAGGADIYVSPLLGYRISDRLSIGVDLSYEYINAKLVDFNGNYLGNYQTYNLGGGVYGRYYVFNNIFAHVQYEVNNYEAQVANNPVYPTDFYNKRISVGSMLIGGGYRQPLGAKSAFTVAILYDVLQNPLSPYAGEPFIIRAGVYFGL